jgi:hypothetical protein
MKTFLAIIGFFLLTFFNSVKQNIYFTKKGEVSFFSVAPIQNIDAHNYNLGVVLNTGNNEIAFSAIMELFQFRRSKMQRDFNVNYVESDKYPNATFKGKINEKIDYSKEGTYHVTATGKLTIHGVSQLRTEKGTLTIEGNKISLASDFKIRVKDFNVKIPVLLTNHIAEVVDVTVKAELIPQEKFISENNLLQQNSSQNE